MSLKSGLFIDLSVGRSAAGTLAVLGQHCWHQDEAAEPSNARGSDDERVAPMPQPGCADHYCLVFAAVARYQSALCSSCLQLIHVSDQTGARVLQQRWRARLLVWVSCCSCCEGVNQGKRRQNRWGYRTLTAALWIELVSDSADCRHHLCTKW